MLKSLGADVTAKDALGWSLIHQVPAPVVILAPNAAVVILAPNAAVLILAPKRPDPAPPTRAAPRAWLGADAAGRSRVRRKARGGKREAEGAASGVVPLGCGARLRVARSRGPPPCPSSTTTLATSRAARRREAAGCDPQRQRGWHDKDKANARGVSAVCTLKTLARRHVRHCCQAEGGGRLGLGCAERLLTGGGR